jgi:hypothetical protein
MDLICISQVVEAHLAAQVVKISFREQVQIIHELLQRP